jgi:hypothetical protein
MQRREEQAGQHDHQAAEPNNDAVDPRLDLGEAQHHSLFQRLQVLLGGELSWITSKISVAIRSAFWRSILETVRALVREGRSVNCHIRA